MGRPEAGRVQLGVLGGNVTRRHHWRMRNCGLHAQSYAWSSPDVAGQTGRETAIHRIPPGTAIELARGVHCD